MGFFVEGFLVEHQLNPLGQLAHFTHVDVWAGNNFAEIHGSAGAVGIGDWEGL